MIGDPELKVAKAYDMLPEGAGTTSQGRTAADNATVRSVFVIGPDKKIKAMLTYPMSTGRNFDEVLRLLDSCQLTAKHKVATPVNWKQGEDVIIVPAVSDDDAKASTRTAGRRRSPTSGSCPSRPDVPKPSERGRELVHLGQLSFAPSSIIRQPGIQSSFTDVRATMIREEDGEDAKCRLVNCLPAPRC